MNSITIEGKGGITATIIADSISEEGQRITTFELEYPRIIHSELMTHRAFSRNAASSRAIPITRATELVSDWSLKPIRWGLKQAGMVAKDQDIRYPWLADIVWEIHQKVSIFTAKTLDRIGVHKQWAGRPLETHQLIKVIVTATTFDNFFYLRYHADAQPEIRELARVMWECFEKSTPRKLLVGQWHTPYYEGGFWTDQSPDTLEDALAISGSCCAQVSYRRLDATLAKARDIFKRLIESKPAHASPVEHTATPVKRLTTLPTKMPEGITQFSIGIDGKFDLWSGNFMNWIQHRHLIPDNTCHHYKGPND